MDELKNLELELKEFYGDKLATEAHLDWVNLKIADIVAKIEELNQVGVN